MRTAKAKIPLPTIVGMLCLLLVGFSNPVFGADRVLNLQAIGHEVFADGGDTDPSQSAAIIVSLQDAATGEPVDHGISSVQSGLPPGWTLIPMRSPPPPLGAEFDPFPSGTNTQSTGTLGVAKITLIPGCWEQGEYHFALTVTQDNGIDVYHGIAQVILLVTDFGQGCPVGG